MLCFSLDLSQYRVSTQILIALASGTSVGKWVKHAHDKNSCTPSDAIAAEEITTKSFQLPNSEVYVA